MDTTHSLIDNILTNSVGTISSIYTDIFESGLHDHYSVLLTVRPKKTNINEQWHPLGSEARKTPNLTDWNKSDFCSELTKIDLQTDITFVDLNEKFNASHGAIKSAVQNHLYSVVSPILNNKDRPWMT